MGCKLKSWLGLSCWLFIRGQNQLVHTFGPSHFSFFFGMILKVGQLSCDPTVTRRRMDNWKYRRSLAAGGAVLLFQDFLLWKEKKSLFDSAIAGVFLLLPGECSASEHEGGLRACRHLG